MIAFACSHCASKLQVKDELAGRKGACPACKQPLIVPAGDRTQAYVPQGVIDGTTSTLSRAGVEGGVTLGQSGASTALHGPDARRPDGSRYVVQGEIARGGMGAVLRAVDRDIRREVALKYLLDQTDPAKKARFVEEAQVTGQLEHPNIVPIHELGMDARQRLFFSMKMVKGRSLAEVLELWRKEPGKAETEYPLGRLLTAFVNVCHALAYAHAQGVVHRDLKPANIMLGDFGEVYVMDWGLAKVLASRERQRPEEVKSSPVAHAPGSPRNSKVLTDRSADTDLTQEGAVLGTPIYMPPEQATGQIDAIDQRSDVYSLGAILYELLTLEPPVEREGGQLAVLLRVAEGQIVPPAQRAPQRARAGKVPPELAAVAMKALAKDQDARYPNVEALRWDVERFQEGRSVSAKADTTRELLWKLVKRNKAVSAATLLFLVLLVGVLGITLKTYLAYRAEQSEKLARTREAVPVLLKLARQSLERRDFDDALTQARVVLDYTPDNAEARLMKGQLLVVRKDYPAALAEMDLYLKQKPDDRDAREVAELCRKARADDATLLTFVEAFSRQKAYALADGVMRQFGPSATEARKGMLAVYRQRLDAAWPGVGARLDMDREGKFHLNVDNFGKQVTSLVPLQGIPLSTLQIASCDQVRDLAPLRGMPLQRLVINGTAVQDLGPLQDAPLVELHAHGCPGVTDLSPLRGMKLTQLNLTQCPGVKDIAPLRGMPLTSLHLHATGVKDIAPLRGMPLTGLELSFLPVQDLALLKDMPLTWLTLRNCGNVRDLAPLRGKKITNLELGFTNVRDLAPLEGMPLLSLGISSCPVQDLAPLRGLPIAWLDLSGCTQIKDFSTLRSLSKLTGLSLTGNPQLQDLKALEGMKLMNLHVNGCGQIKDLTPLRGMPLTSLLLADCGQLSDLTPLDGMNLEGVMLTPKNYSKPNLDVLRRMKSLKSIGPGWGDKPMPADEFWKKYDMGAFK
ncbi:MAG: protein kinase [Gemmataceae bacterium]|nr:protein kinase [Gemmataceae bacterium]